MYILWAYIFSYALTTLTLIFFFQKYIQPNYSKHFKLIYLIIFLNISGLPFFIGFYGKLPIILYFLQKSSWLTLSIFIYFNIVFLNMYVNLLNSLYFNKNKYIFNKTLITKTQYYLIVLNIFWFFLIDKLYTISYVFFC